MAKQTKTLEYRRARFLGNEQELELLVRQAWEQCLTQADRTITFSDGRSTCGLRARDCDAAGFAVHCGRYMDGQAVGTIPTLPAPEVDVKERPPEPGENFLNSDIMALIRGNHVICMNCGKNAGALRIFFQGLFRRAGFDDATSEFELVRISSPDKVAAIQAVGVKSIDLKVDISEAAAEDLSDGYAGDGFWANIQRKFDGALAAITSKDKALEQLRHGEKGTLKVSINIPNGDLTAAKEALDEFAEEIVGDDEADAFVIHLRDNTTIKRTKFQSGNRSSWRQAQTQLAYIKRGMK